MADIPPDGSSSYTPLGITTATTIIKRWEAWLSISMFAITTAVQQNVIPDGRWSRLAMWGVSILAQIGLVFGRPLLIRGPAQPIQIGEKKHGG